MQTALADIPLQAEDKSHGTGSTKQEEKGKKLKSLSSPARPLNYHHHAMPVLRVLIEKQNSHLQQTVQKIQLHLRFRQRRQALTPLPSSLVSLA